MDSVKHIRICRGSFFSLPGLLLLASIWGDAIWGVNNASFAHTQLPFKRNQTKQQGDQPNRNAPSKLMVIPPQWQHQPVPETEEASYKRAPGQQSNPGNRPESDVRQANYQQSQGTTYQSPSLSPEVNSMPDALDHYGRMQGRMGSGFSEPNLNRPGAFGNDPMQGPRPNHYPVRQNAPANEIMAPTHTLDENYGLSSTEHPENNSQYGGSRGDQTQNPASPNVAGASGQFDDGNGQAFGQQHYGNGQGHLHDGANLYGRRLGQQQPSATEIALSFQNENLSLKEKINRMQKEAENRDRQLETALTTIRRQQEELTITQSQNNELKNQTTALARERDNALKMRENSERQYSEQLKGIETMLDSALITELTDKK